MDIWPQVLRQMIPGAENCPKDGAVAPKRSLSNTIERGRTWGFEA